jgi:hypothetical protein
VPDDRPPWDSVRAAFYLVAAVVAVHALVVLVTVGFCAFYGGDLIAGRFQCDARDRLAELLAAALAAALAFAGGQVRK